MVRDRPLLSLHCHSASPLARRKTHQRHPWALHRDTARTSQDSDGTHTHTVTERAPSATGKTSSCGCRERLPRGTSELWRRHSLFSGTGEGGLPGNGTAGATLQRYEGVEPEDKGQGVRGGRSLHFILKSASGRMLSPNSYFSEMRKPRLREVVHHAQGHTAANGLSEAQV